MFLKVAFLLIKYGVLEKDELVKLLSSDLGKHQDFSFGNTPFFEKIRRKNDRIRMKGRFLMWFMFFLMANFVPVFYV